MEDEQKALPFAVGFKTAQVKEIKDEDQARYDAEWARFEAELEREFDTYEGRPLQVSHRFALNDV